MKKILIFILLSTLLVQAVAAASILIDDFETDLPATFDLGQTDTSIGPTINTGPDILGTRTTTLLRNTANSNGGSISTQMNGENPSLPEGILHYEEETSAEGELHFHWDFGSAQDLTDGNTNTGFVIRARGLTITGTVRATVMHDGTPLAVDSTFLIRTPYDFTLPGCDRSNAVTCQDFDEVFIPFSSFPNPSGRGGPPSFTEVLDVTLLFDTNIAPRTNAHIDVFKVVGPINCVMSEWSSFSSCSASCGPGIQARTRTILTQPQFGGTLCGHTQEVQACNLGTCPPVHCETSVWSEWSPCTRTCGGGESSRSRTVITAPAHGGDACGDLEQTRSCSSHPCIVQCEANFYNIDDTCQPCPFGGESPAGSFSVDDCSADSPFSMKQQVISILEESANTARVGNYRKNILLRAVNDTNRSLDGFVDEYNLNDGVHFDGEFESFRRIAFDVFDNELRADRKLRFLLRSSRTLPSVKDDVRQARLLLGSADQQLSYLHLQQAQAQAEDPENPFVSERLADYYLRKAHGYYNAGVYHLERGDVWRAIHRFRRSWFFSQRLIEYTSAPLPS